MLNKCIIYLCKFGMDWKSVVCMGKQVNYWMDFDSFLLLAKKAVDLGCTIFKEDRNLGRVIESKDTSIVTANQNQYYFHFAEAGDISIKMMYGREVLDRCYSACSNSIIEAGYSYVLNEPTGVGGTQRKKEIRRARIYCQSGYYDEQGEYIQRPECLTKIYNSLARYVKKLAPYTELTDLRISTRDEDYGREYEYRHKEYITDACMDMVNKDGYKLC